MNESFKDIHLNNEEIQYAMKTILVNHVTYSQSLNGKDSDLKGEARGGLNISTAPKINKAES